MLEVERVSSISDQVKQHDYMDESVVTSLRAAYPDIHFTYCLDDDITSGKPVIENEKFKVYLIDGREHCLCLTNDYEVATGIVIAEVIEEEA